jgi:hypothetical protein
VRCVRGSRGDAPTSVRVASSEADDARDEGNDEKKRSRQRIQTARIWTALSVSKKGTLFCFEKVSLSRSRTTLEVHSLSYIILRATGVSVGVCVVHLCVSADTVRSEVLWSDTPLLSRKKKGGISVDPLRRVYSRFFSRGVILATRVRDRNPAVFGVSYPNRSFATQDRSWIRREMLRVAALRCFSAGNYLEESGDAV